MIPLAITDSHQVGEKIENLSTEIEEPKWK